MAIGLHHNIPFDALSKNLEQFKGTWRRFENLGKYKGTTIISDYGHHPEAIQATLEGARELYPDKRIGIVFQPHQHNRTKELFNDFTIAFNGADYIIIAEIFDVLGREEDHDQNISSEDMVNKIKESGAKEVYYAPDLIHTKTELDKHIQKNDIVIIMGAGDIYKVAEGLFKA